MKPSIPASRLFVVCSTKPIFSRILSTKFTPNWPRIALSEMIFGTCIVANISQSRAHPHLNRCGSTVSGRFNVNKQRRTPSSGPRVLGLVFAYGADGQELGTWGWKIVSQVEICCSLLQSFRYFDCGFHLCIPSFPQCVSGKFDRNLWHDAIVLNHPSLPS